MAAFAAHTTVTTDKASRYLQALCGHFSRKVTASYTPTEGTVDFGFGRCRMTAKDETLVIYLQSDTEEAFARLKHVVSDHLERFAVKDGLKADWAEAAQPSQKNG